MRLLYLITSLDFGGAEIQVLQLSRRFRSKGWELHVVSMLPPQAFVAELESLGVVVSSLDMREGVPNPLGILHLAQIIRDWQPNIVHSHMVHANLLSRVTRLFAPIPALVCTAHNIYEGPRWRELAYRFTDPLCDLTTNVSRAGMQRSIKVGSVSRYKVQVFPNGVDDRRFQPSAQSRKRIRTELKLKDKFIWLAVGRFEPNKDYPTMLKSFAEVQDSYPKAILLIAGKGPLKNDCQNLANELGIEEEVRFLGMRKDIPALMNAADAFVMSSAWEGLPMVLLEASASGLPLVATDVGGNNEIVLQNKTGLLVPSKNSAALSGAMSKMMSLPVHERQRFGQDARKHIESRYSLEQIVNDWEDLYCSFIQSCE